MNNNHTYKCIEIKTEKSLFPFKEKKLLIKLPKRVTKLSVKRNKIRRRIRAILNNKNDSSVDIIIKIRKNLVTTKFAQLSSIIFENLERTKSE